MKPYYDHAGIVIHCGDCREVLPAIGQVDAVVTDPPYGLEFMGKGWDRGVPGVEFWERVRDAMKPGAHLFAFGGTRTFHRLICAIEDAGLEIRDCVMWLYGSGFPKSLDVGEAIDKAADVEREVGGKYQSPEGTTGENSKDDEYGFGVGNMSKRFVTAPATHAAKQWDGWGTALKPAWEPIILARKPLDGTVAENVLKHGVGGLNIDACRVEIDVGDPNRRPNAANHNKTVGNEIYGARKSTAEVCTQDQGYHSSKGRWPANVIHDGSEEVMAEFGKAGERPGATSNSHGSSADQNCYGKYSKTQTEPGYNDTGSAARFFYCAKASRHDRRKDNDHPTVKPLALMRYLCRLIAPPGGVVLDPFMGSGSTLRAARDLGFKAVGIEIEEPYCEIAAKRLAQGVFAFNTD